MKPKITVVTTLLLCVSMTTFIPATGSRAEEKTCQAFGAYANGSSGNDQSRWDKRMNQWFGVDPKSIRSPANITKMIDWVESCIKHGSPRNGPEGLESVANQLRNDLARLIKATPLLDQIRKLPTCDDPDITKTLQSMIKESPQGRQGVRLVALKNIQDDSADVATSVFVAVPQVIRACEGDAFITSGELPSFFYTIKSMDDGQYWVQILGQ